MSDLAMIPLLPYEKSFAIKRHTGLAGSLVLVPFVKSMDLRIHERIVKLSYLYKLSVRGKQGGGS